MVSADIRAVETIVKGVNSNNLYVRSEAHRIDGGENSGVLAVDTHKLFDLPKGAMVTGLKIASLETAVSGGSATVKFGVMLSGTTVSEDLCDAIAKADLAAGDVICCETSKIQGYGKDATPTITMTVGTAAFTTLDLFVVVEYIPLDSFLTNG